MTTDLHADPRAAAGFECHVTYLADLARRGGGDVVEADGALLWAGPHDFPFIFNGAARIDPSASASRVVAAAQQFFADRGRGFQLDALDGRDGDLADAAVAAGLHLGGLEPLQAIDEAPPAGPTPDGVELRTVADAAGVGDLTAVVADAHRVYGIADDVFEVTFADPATVLASDVTALVAYDGSRPVATSHAVLFGDTVYIGWVAVIADAGRRGLGRYVTEAAVRAGLERGARRAVLQASPMGAPLYRKMGFADVGSVRSAIGAPA